MPLDSAPRPAPSLRARLTRLLLLAVLLIACVQAAVTWRTASTETEAVFDAQMERIALSLTGGLASAVLGEDALAPGSGADDLIIQIWRADGAMLYRSRSARLLPQQAVLGFANVRVAGAAYRVYALQTPLQVIQVAQDLASRRQIAGRLALRAVLPIAALAPLLMLIVWWVIGHALAPVEQLRRQVATRRAHDLAPLAVDGLPAEVLPLVTEMNGLLSRLAAAWDALQNFTADAAHELRSPLAALRLQLQSLQRAEGPEARRVANERLLSGIDRATRLVEQLLALARQEGGNGDAVPPSSVNLNRLAQGAVQEFAREAATRGVILAPPLAPQEEVIVSGHEQGLAVLLRNLLENALRYTPEGGRVQVQVAHAPPKIEGPGLSGSKAPQAWLIVEDSGPGIAPEERQRVLDRFYRVAGAAGHGSGLGLAIVKAVADRHGAQVKLDESPALGGLKVTVEFS
ncbi:ATP-binding protein [Ottowia thiooxydans]|uniref:ATP-binding protein n=1 Tax=Ottowia thiooxydans TaxID=219182 RepID=UPI0004131A45|nr:ATP-binding protein [Ottowia thiooxydans]